MINEILNLLNECKNNLFKYYLVQDFDDNDNFFILLYKIQPIRFNIIKLEEKIENLNDRSTIQNNANDVNEINLKVEKLKSLFNSILKEIETKYQENLVLSKDQNIKIILPFLMFQLLKYNIIYTNLFDGISLLETNKNYLSLKKKQRYL